jgi:hypothetical protein
MIGSARPASMNCGHSEEGLPAARHPGSNPGGPVAWLGQMTPGQALVALRAALTAAGLPTAGMTVSRWQGTLTLAGGPGVRYCCGWLFWPTGRLSRRGRLLYAIHGACDPAGAARRLALRSPTWAPGGDTEDGGAGQAVASLVRTHRDGKPVRAGMDARMGLAWAGAVTLARWPVSGRCGGWPASSMLPTP